MLRKIFRMLYLMHRRIYDRILKKMFPPGMLEIRKARINGYEMFVLVNEDVGRAIKYFHKYEKAETEFITSAIEQGGKVYIDVGANIGYFTLLLASMAKDAVVHSFEPIPTNFHILALNVEMNQFRNVVLNNRAVGSEKRFSSEFSVAQDSAYSSFRDTKRKVEIDRIEVSVITLDEYIYEKGIGKVDFIKIDVEGAEKMVLDGAKRLLRDKNRHPRMMMIELYDDNLKHYSTSIGDIVKSLDSVGYKPFIAENGSLKYFEESHHNVICNVFFVL